ncbi:MAG: hypothetical protein LC733_05700, partial [Actinobacteria bacterium]|nr:hypothetical protein [Actinomycetota bacterium]
MALFSKPIARIYVEELKDHLDDKVVAIFSPDTDLQVGDFGSFEDGQFVTKGNVASRGVELDVRDRKVNPFEFASQGKVSIG